MTWWFFIAVIAAVSLSLQSLGLQALEAKHAITSYMSWVWLGASAVLALVAISRNLYISFTGGALILLVGAGIASFIGMYAFGKALRYQPNVGYVETVTAVRTVPIYAYATIVVGATIDVVSLLALAACVGSVVVLGNDGRKHSSAEADHPHTSTTRSVWIVWALVSAGTFGVLIILTNEAIAMGVDPISATSVVLAVAGIIFIATAMLTDGGSSLRRVVVRSPRLLGGTIVAAAAGNLALFAAVSESANAAYPVAVSSARIVILYCVGLKISESKIVWQKTAAVVAMTIAVVVLGRA